MLLLLFELFTGLWIINFCLLYLIFSLKAYVLLLNFTQFRMLEPNLSIHQECWSWNISNPLSIQNNHKIHQSKFLSKTLLCLCSKMFWVGCDGLSFKSLQWYEIQLRKVLLSFSCFMHVSSWYAFQGSYQIA